MSLNSLYSDIHVKYAHFNCIIQLLSVQVATSLVDSPDLQVLEHTSWKRVLAAALVLVGAIKLSLLALLVVTGKELFDDVLEVVAPDEAGHVGVEQPHDEFALQVFVFAVHVQHLNDLQELLPAYFHFFRL